MKTDNCQMLWDAIIIGGGASGVMAALSFQKNMLLSGLNEGKILILEKNDRILKKVLATGNGRCNITNDDCSLSHFHSHHPEYVSSVMASFSKEDTLSFFQDLSIPTVSEGTKRFPESLQAASVVDALRYALSDAHVEVKCDTSVKEIKKSDTGSFTILCDDDAYSAKTVIIASGGACAESFGTTGDGYTWLSTLSHPIYAPRPSIVQLCTDESAVKPISGQRIKARTMLYEEDNLVAEIEDEVLFVDYGLSGPAIFYLSGEVSRRMQKGRLIAPMSIVLSLFSSDKNESLLLELQSRRNRFANREISTILLGMVSNRISAVLLKSAIRRPMHLKIGTLSDEELMAILSILMSWRFPITGTASLKQAQTTIGGAQMTSFSVQTLESKIVSRLFACGEVLDVDGDCGGYNLQWAWSSGYVAGKSASDVVRCL